MNHAGWNKTWSEFVIENDIKQTMANANEAAKKRGL